ncbi:Clp protease ClpP [Salmonella enterica subsp. enterica]|uniref:ClpP-like prohead protease/major capsid protein fusion protein n=2 Tax=Salmonella enterica TaxID=28901 RepID=UPI00076B97F6|nr:ClpP-like prohead protease/major capsid protein fusion protein [Salmonella enterica]EAW1595206.1 Clp protease ClpP [Salmonella enterica subsp. enterica]EEP8537289.1 Clp protease ClpP [Salmonella enterica subsp. enterica serovar Zega]EAW1604544.1 Clp protease ClpP [Salmonella enterica subsp. enterica]EAW1807420.1 Clp protease ClpP [Salmonella enterica subsp. enterica]EBP6406727.1 Clp protease ClpP [Salmonella enterica subsp. enterica]
MELTLYDAIFGDVAKNLAADIAKAGKLPLTLAIHSPGGSTVDGFMVANALSRYPGYVTARIDGIAASMATIVACAARRVTMASNAWYMIHNPWGMAGGDAEEFRKNADLLERTQTQMIAAYAKKTGLGDDEIRALMDAETWMTADEAKEKGFVDEIYPSEDSEAFSGATFYAALDNFQNAPQAVKDLLKPNPATDKPEDISRIFSSCAKADANEVLQVKARYEMGGVSLDDARGVLSFLDSCAGLAHVESAELRQQLINGKISLTQAREGFLEEMAKEAKPAGGVWIYAGNGSIVSDSVRACLMHRTGLAEPEKDNRYAGYSLRELARASLQDRNISISGMNTMQMVGLAFTHSASDFGNILGDVANKSMLTGWNDSPETFDQWTRTGSLPDFKPGHRVGLDTFPRLREVREGAEYKYVTTSDRGEQIILATYGELFSITRQAIINDDLAALSTIPQAMGRAAKATVGDLVYAVLTNNIKMSDGKPLFHTTHGNFISGELSIECLATARSMMRLQKSAGGQVLNIVPKFLFVPACQEALAEQVIKSISVLGQSNAGVYNPVKDTLGIIVEPRFDAVEEKSWYLAAAKGADTIEVAYLDGNAAPYIESSEGFTVDGVTYKVRVDAGVAPMDWRGLLKSVGTAPAEA